MWNVKYEIKYENEKKRFPEIKTKYRYIHIKLHHALK